jgi:hypothetical protein
MRTWDNVEDACRDLGGTYDEDEYTGFFTWGDRCIVEGVEFGHVGDGLFVRDESDSEVSFEGEVNHIRTTQNGLFIDAEGDQMTEAGYGNYYRNSQDAFREEEERF